MGWEKRSQGRDNNIRVLGNRDHENLKFKSKIRKLGESRKETVITKVRRSDVAVDQVARPSIPRVNAFIKTRLLASAPVGSVVDETHSDVVL